MTYLRIKELAMERGLNITTLGRRAELAYTTTHALWHGTATQFSLKTLERVACALGVSVGDRFAGQPDPGVLQAVAPPPSASSTGSRADGRDSRRRENPDVV
jgi:DNA-binding Xre family transcriptional regulator